MTRTVQLTTEIPASREIVLRVPGDFPTGWARVLLETLSRNRARTLGELAKSEYFGIWKDRSDIEDSRSFARDLRRRAWSRQG
jgi:hypothetical protein